MLNSITVIHIVQNTQEEEFGWNIFGTSTIFCSLTYSSINHFILLQMKSSILFIASLLASTCALSQEKVNSATSNNGNTITWTINEPDVRKSSEPFFQIRFQKNDEIFITAGGCVQTGGHGKTWKRYVNPSGDGNAYYYFAKIQIPSVTFGLVRMEQFLNRKLFFTQNPDNNSYLILGYADDDYSDNGYSGHDDGTEDQCKGVGNAWVTIVITHHTTPPPPPQGRTAGRRMGQPCSGSVPDGASSDGRCCFPCS